MACKIWPNGEASVWKPKKFRLELSGDRRTHMRRERDSAIVWLFYRDPVLLGKILCAMGLSPLSISDKTPEGIDISQAAEKDGRNRKGLKGISRYGCRMVRNASHVIQNEVGRGRLSFVTATVPGLPVEEMAVLHENWGKLTELYRLGLKRILQKGGVTGEIVTVSEVQEERYENTGIPVLHIHGVFVGRKRGSNWILTPKEHDRVWKNALSAVLGRRVKLVNAACNIQRVKKSAEGYLGKYMTKGGHVVAALVGTSFESFIPKHWWGCSRSLSGRVKQQIKAPRHLAGWLYDVAGSEFDDVWERVHEVVLQNPVTGEKYIIARTGRLKADFVQCLTNTG